MANTIKIKRGLKTDLPTLAVGEMGYCTDTNELFIGTSTGNVLINEGGEVSSEPTITEVDNTAGNEYMFTLTNNDDYPATVRYELGSTPPLANEIELDAGETSQNITLSGLDDDTNYTLYAQSIVNGKLMSSILDYEFTTPSPPTLKISNTTNNFTFYWDTQGENITITPNSFIEVVIDTETTYRLENNLAISGNFYIDNVQFVNIDASADYNGAVMFYCNFDKFADITFNEQPSSTSEVLLEEINAGEDGPFPCPPPGF